MIGRALCAVAFALVARSDPYDAAGGCRGTAMIKGVVVAPPNDCLSVNENNCNGGDLHV